MPADITEQDMTAALFELSIDMLCVANTDGYFVRVNPAGEQILGMTQTELLAQPFTDLIHPDDQAASFEQMARLGRGESTVRFRNRFRRKDGSYIWLSWSVVQRDSLYFCTARNVDDKVRLEREFEASRRRLEGLVEIAPVGIYSFNAEGVCDYVNPQFLDSAGWSEEELFNGKWVDAIHPEDRGRVVANWQQFLETGTFKDISYRYVRKQGDVRFVEARSKALKGPSGEALGVVGVVNDVTELTGINKMLREAAQLGRVGAWEVEARTMTPKWSDEMRRIFRVPADFESTLEDAYQFYPPEVQQILGDCVQSAMATGESWDLEVPAQTLCGKPLWLRVAGRPELVNGFCTRIVGIAQDLTERHNNLQEQRATNQKMRLLFEHAPLGMVLYTMDGQYVQANRAYQDIVGYTEDELKTMGHLALIPAEFRVLVERKLRELASTGQFKAIEKDLIRKGGARVPVMTIGCLVHDHEGTPFIWAIVEDVSIKREMDLARAEQERLLAEANQALAESNRELQEFTYAASHDLREPLRTIASFCELLEEDVAGGNQEAIREDLRVITAATRRLQKLVRDLLDLSRSGKQPLTFREVDLNDCLATVRADLNEAITEAAATIVIEELPKVRADAEHLARVFQNLISNAIKYQAPDSKAHIRVWATDEGNLTAVHVQDNGIGIAPQYHARIFDAFKRLHGQHEYEGSGIGLAICKKTIERHGGRMLIDSSPGNGSKFTVLLPNAAEEAAA